MLNWRELIVTDVEGNTDTLGALVDRNDSLLNHATITDGRITEADGAFLSAPGEDADWDTPRVEVDWTGFVEALCR